jgi:sulfonate dioxygenase
MQSDAPSGGDTLVGSLVEAYERLSPPMKQFLCGLRAVHSSKVMTAKASRVGGASRRKDVESIHPVVYEQPVSSKQTSSREVITVRLTIV